MSARAKHEARQPLAQFVLSVAGMRRAVALAIVLIVSKEESARALETRSELTIAREFVFLTNDLAVELVDGQLALGGGITMVSDYAIERYGAQALIEYHGAHVAAGVAATFGPRQTGRGWASLDPHVEALAESGRWKIRVEGGVLLRRIDAAARHTLISVDQLQLHAAAEVTVDDHWRAGALALYSFYGPDLTAPSLRDLDLGLAVTLAGRPERWAAGASVARRAGRRLWLELGAAAVVYAAGGGAAVVPRAALRLGAWRGVSVGLSGEVVVGVSGSAIGEPPREIGGIELEYER